MIFAREVSDNLTSLVKAIDKATAENSKKKMGSFVVFCNDSEKLEGELKELAKKEKLSRKIAIGTVRAYKDDKRRLSLRPASEAQGKKPLGFKVRKNAQVTLDGDQAELGDIEEGQQAQIRYVVKNDVNRAIIVQLFSKQPSGEDKKKKEPSGEDDKSG